jgi:hypothetical protein
LHFGINNLDPLERELGREEKEGVVVLRTIIGLGGCRVLHRVDVDGEGGDGVGNAVKSDEAV